MRLTRPRAALAALALGLICAPAFASNLVLEQIATANRAGKTVFLVVTDAAANNLDAARQTAQAAADQTPGSAVLVLNRSDPAQAEAVQGYRVAGAPVPMVMVIASNGVAAGASLVKKGAVERLVSLVPTPAKARYLGVLAAGQTAVVIFSHAEMPLQSPLFLSVSTVVEESGGKVTPVLVEVTDRAEQRFLQEWKVDPKGAEPTVIIMNPKGQTLGRLEGAPSAAKIVEVSKKRPCCGDPSCKGCK
ncbi:MAG: hypothetical protein O2894_11215 [Planctomycetota bacterium]|nr:hypothetical protein [Planctomycetota bacterium]